MPESPAEYALTATKNVAPLAHLTRFVQLAVGIGCVAGLLACASEKPQPAPLGPSPTLLPVRSAWTSQLGAVGFALQPSVAGNTVLLAANDGTVAALDARNGSALWRASVGNALSAGVGSDGKLAAVVTRSNELVSLDAGRELWRQKLSAQVFTAPLVAGARVFVLSADRSISAFDGQSGSKLWSVQRPGEPLVLRQAGVLTAVGDTLVVGVAGRLLGINPANGSIRWEAPIATPRGTNDIERLVDLTGPVSRLGDVLCVRAFQSAVGCVNATRGTVLWTRPANGAEGLQGDDSKLYGSEADGKLLAWKRANGERAWASEQLLRRGVSAPAVQGAAVVVGDDAGLVHWFAREDGTPLARMATDASGLAFGPVVVGNTLVVVTRAGTVYGFVPQ